MQQIVYFFQKYKYFLYFLLLQVISLVLTITNHSFHKSKFISSTNYITGGIYGKISNFEEYFNLKSENNLLLEENNVLKNRLEILQKQLDFVETITIIDSLKYNQKYSYISGKIINNEYLKSYNYITLNRGEKDSITVDMAVVNSKGIIGVVDDVSNGYARVRSILNENSKINARFKHSYYFGTLKWNSKDYNIVQLTDIPRQANFNVGDTIITGGKSSIFPEGIPVGTILNIPKNKTALNTIDVKLFNDMSNLGHVYIIKNFDKQEIKKLERN